MGERADEFRHADHAIHRRTQFVAHAREEVALRFARDDELLIRRAQFLGPQGDFRFELLLRGERAAQLWRAVPAPPKE
jgi:hypothetical protein